MEHEMKPGRTKTIMYDNEKNKMVEIEKRLETFDDVGGLEDVKKKIRTDFIVPIQSPEIFEAFGKKIGGSLLFYGPPGCGKTFLARTVAGEINARFFHLDIQAILSKWLGESEQNLHELFEDARRQAPCVLFIDELDALGGNRQHISHHTRTLVNQLLVEMDGSASKNEGVYIIGATNTPWYLDPALRRPGRFDSLVFLPPPAQEEREAILKLKTKGKPTEDLQLELAAKYTEHFSGADLEYLVKDAIDSAITRSYETGTVQPMTNEDLLYALERRKPTTLEWFHTAKSYAKFSDANQEYKDVLDYIYKHDVN
ncbi:ATPase family associated with various cellular activities (AAA) [Terribacillus halophilus]|uniref:ATPase family associated with various cellular activities (AAA) n=1 Tax=Terribacillus halophilus TaxID=361279 RepID=A0A1G6QLY7_9BACI|nr:ATP-binding protein [Terribacillus halophilus]SDC93044.1 ATPase family associated with various cellular activities (AAA) [Terribacillus halophilus]